MTHFSSLLLILFGVLCAPDGDLYAQGNKIEGFPSDLNKEKIVYILLEPGPMIYASQNNKRMTKTMKKYPFENLGVHAVDLEKYKKQGYKYVLKSEWVMKEYTDYTETSISTGKYKVKKVPHYTYFLEDLGTGEQYRGTQKQDRQIIDAVKKFIKAVNEQYGTK